MLTDDLDGSEAIETISFGFEGTQYELDLNKENADDVREPMAPYIGSARKVGGRTSTRRSSPSSGRGVQDTRAIRAWAQENDFEINSRGRIPRNVIEAYEAAH